MLADTSLLILALAPGLLTPRSQAGEGDIIFYGYAPPTSLDTRGLGGGYAYLDIVGINDSTSVGVFYLRTGAGLAEASVDRMQLWTYRLPEGTYFKVVADKMVSASLSADTFAVD